MDRVGLFWELGEYSDQALLSAVLDLVGTGRKVGARLLAHLGEVEERRLHLDAGYGSMFAYCVVRLGMSEDEACRRIDVARLARRFPAFYPLLEAGRLSLSVAALSKPFITAHNAEGLLAELAEKSVQQARELLAARYPRPDVKSSIRKLPERRGNARTGNTAPDNTVAGYLAAGTAAAGYSANGNAANGDAAAGNAANGDAAAGNAANGYSVSDDATTGNAAPGYATAGCSAPANMAAGKAAHGYATAGYARAGNAAGHAAARNESGADPAGDGAARLDSVGQLGLSGEGSGTAGPRATHAVVPSTSVDGAAPRAVRSALGPNLAVLVPLATVGADRSTSLQAGDAGHNTRGEEASTPTLALAPPRCRSIEPLAVGRYRVQFTANAELKSKLELARDLLRHALPGGDFGAIIGRGLDLLIEQQMQRHFGRRSKGRKGRGLEGRPPEIGAGVAEVGHEGRSPSAASFGNSSSEARLSPSDVSAVLAPPERAKRAAARPHIDRETRRQVLERDGLQCSWRGADGLRCTARAWLEHDHVVPWGMGGPSSAENLRLLCRAHNRRAAERDYGRHAIEQTLARLQWGVRGGG